MYDAALCRFLSPDNYVQDPFNSQNYNRYSYCMNNPLKYTDPSGEFFIVDDWIVGFVNGFFSTGSNRFEAGWNQANKQAGNEIKIWGGLFETDPNRNFWERSWQLISRFTWELPQTTLGWSISSGRNIAGDVDNVDYYGGATLVNKNDNSREKWGFTLGPYINSKNMVADPYTDDMFRHEYGHTLQSQLVGPLYLTHVAIQSLIGQGLDDMGLNDHNKEWYETQANRMSYRYFKNHDNKALDTLPWDDTKYPRNYNPNWYWTISHPPLQFMWWLFF
jgi:hypothetical protein